MEVIIKEFGLGSTTNNLTKILSEKRNNTTFLLFFEWIYPQLEYSDFINIVGISFKKFTEQKKFKLGLSAFASYLIALMKDKNFDEVDINFVLIKFTERKLFISRFGDLDIYMYNQANNSLQDISKILPYNTNLNNLEYLKTDAILDNLLLVSNFGVISNLFESSLIDVSSTAKLFESLTHLKDSVLESKTILLVGHLNNLNLEPLSTSEVEASPFTDRNELSVNKPLSTLEKQRITIFNNIKVNIIKSIDSVKKIIKVIPSVTSKGVGKLKASKFVSSFLQSKKIELPSRERNKQLLLEESELKKAQLVSQGLPKTTTNVENYNAATYSDNSNANKSLHTPPQIDALTYFRLKRTWYGRLKLFFMNFYNKLAKKLRNMHIVNRLPFASSISKWGGNGKKIGVIFGATILAVVALVFLFLQYRHLKNLKKQDEVVMSDIKEKVISLQERVDSLQKDSNLQANVEIYNACTREADELVTNINKLQDKVNFADTRSWMQEQVSKVQELKNKCLHIYKKTFNIIDLKFEEIKDFKATFGDQSQLSNVNVYKGIVLVVDRGRKIIYQVNTANGKVIKLKDPNSKLKDPYKVGFGEAQDGTPIIFVCDRQNGILFYNSNTGFNSIPGTDNVAMGASCTSVGGFGTKAYFTTENGDAIYKLVNIGGGYAFPKAYVSLGKSAKIVDFAIDGSIYVLGQYPKEGGYAYDILKFYGGQKDNFILSNTDKMRMQEPVQIFSNPSGYKPLYIFDKQTKMIYVMEKPTYKKHPGVGTFIKTYDLSGLEDGNITSFAVELSVNNNQETYIYVVANDKLFKAQLR